MSEETFKELLSMVQPSIRKKNTFYRESVTPETRLAITLRFLATGDSLTSLAYLFKVSKQCISTMLPEVLKAIIRALKEYVKLPTTEEEWKEIAGDFDRRWHFPHCMGALDGKHVVIQRPENTTSEYFNYKGTQSIVLMALVDANYRFAWVNVGCQGRISDGGVFKNSSLYNKMEKGALKIPPDAPLPGRESLIPYVIVADDAFALQPNVMKPFPNDLSKGSPKRVYNYRLSRARRIVENAFGLLASVFRIFRKPIEIKVLDTVVDIVLACVLLHNFLRSKPESARYYSPSGSCDNEDSSSGEIIRGTWRDITSNDTGLIPLQPIPRRSSRAATEIRNEFMEYFMTNEGSVPFQNKYM